MTKLRNSNCNQTQFFLVITTDTLTTDEMFLRQPFAISQCFNLVFHNRINSFIWLYYNCVLFKPFQITSKYPLKFYFSKINLLSRVLDCQESRKQVPGKFPPLPCPPCGHAVVQDCKMQMFSFQPKSMKIGI